ERGYVDVGEGGLGAAVGRGGHGLGPPSNGFFIGRRLGVRGGDRGVLDCVEELAAEVVHARGEFAETLGELVVADDGGDGDDEAGGGGDEGFRDAGSDGAEGGGAGGAEAVEGVDDAHDGAEEADEGSALGGGGEPGHAAFHDGEGLGGGGLGGTLEGLGVGWLAAAAGLALVFVVDLMEDGDEWGRLELVGDRGDFGEAAGLAEGAQEAAALHIGLIEGAPLGDDDGPGDDAGDEQDAEDGERGGAAVVDHVHDGVRVRTGEWTGGGGRVLQEESEGEDSHMLNFSVNARGACAVLPRKGRFWKGEDRRSEW